MVWHGDLELRGRIALRNRHGLSFVLVFNDIPQQPQHPPQTSSEIWPEESDDESLLQLRGSPSTAAHSTQNGGLDCWWHWKQLLAESTGSWTSRRSRTTRTRAWLPASNIIWLLRSTRLVQFWSWSPDNTIWSTTPFRKPSTRPSPIRDQTTDYDPGAGSLWSFVDLHRRILYTSHEENDAGKSRWTRASWHLGVCRRCWELWNHAAFQTYGSWLDCPTSPLWPKWIFICWDNQNWIRHGRKICSDWCGHVEIVSEPWHHYSLLFRLSTRRRTSCRQFGHGSSRWIIQATPQSFSSTRTCTSWGLIFIMSELMLGSCSLRLPTSQQNRKHNNLSIFLDSFDRTRWKVHFQQLWPFLEINMDYHHGDMAVWISNDQIYHHARCHNGMKSSGTIVTRHPALRVVLGLPTFNCTVDHKGMEGNCIVCNNKCACSISTAWPYRKGSLILACRQPTTYYESVQVHLGPTMAVRFGSTLTCLMGTPIVTNPCCSARIIFKLYMQIRGVYFFDVILDISPFGPWLVMHLMEDTHRRIGDNGGMSSTASHTSMSTITPFSSWWMLMQHRGTRGGPEWVVSLRQWIPQHFVSSYMHGVSSSQRPARFIMACIAPGPVWMIRDHCIDHAVFPIHWKSRCTHSAVLTDFDLANVSEDHKAVAIQLQWQEVISMRKRSTAAEPFRSMQQYQYSPDLAAYIDNLLAPSWHTDLGNASSSFGGPTPCWIPSFRHQNALCA